MIELYILLILLFALIVWLIVRKKWKTLLWTVVSTIILVIAGWYLFLHIVSEAFGAKCEKNREWEIENYVIVEKKCIGFAGPYYYPVYLYEDNVELDQLLFINDSTCVVKFKPDERDTLTFDICDLKLIKNRK
jgi:4-amino-4-deoxy-L-arabinose transferase-like glycosyltransferase